MLLSLFRIRQNGIGLRDIPEDLLCMGFRLLTLVVLVGVPLQSQLTVGILDVFLRRLLLNAQDFVVVLFLCFFCLLLGMFQL